MGYQNNDRPERHDTNSVYISELSSDIESDLTDLEDDLKKLHNSFVNDTDYNNDFMQKFNSIINAVKFMRETSKILREETWTEPTPN